VHVVRSRAVQLLYTFTNKECIPFNFDAHMLSCEYLQKIHKECKITKNMVNSVSNAGFKLLCGKVETGMHVGHMIFQYLNIISILYFTTKSLCNRVKNKFPKEI